MPGFRKTPEEVGRIEKFLRPARFKEDAAAIDFKTTWEFARWVLPPCFEPIGDKAKNTADGFVYIASCESAYGGEQEFGSISLRVDRKSVV